jgi:predicted nucleic acid-binding protein
VSAVPSILLDACSLINFVASGVALNVIAEANDCRFAATTIAMDETLYIAGTTPGERELIDIEALARLGVLTVVELNPAEVSEFVALAQTVDDGEASTLAVAQHRGLSVATDDRRAVRLANELGINVHTTAAILRRWSAACFASEEQIATALWSVEVRGNFVPRREDANRIWWDSCLGRR